MDRCLLRGVLSLRTTVQIVRRDVVQYLLNASFCFEGVASFCVSKFLWKGLRFDFGQAGRSFLFIFPVLYVFSFWFETSMCRLVPLLELCARVC